MAIQETVFSLTGIVTPFRGNGRKLGYPTANIVIPHDTEEGLFLGYTHIDGARLPSIIFIGAPTTLDDMEKRAESHILDHPDEDLYDKEVTFEVIAKMRDNFTFDSVDELTTQMKQDERDARIYFEMDNQ